MNREPENLDRASYVASLVFITRQGWRSKGGLAPIQRKGTRMTNLRHFAFGFAATIPILIIVGGLVG